jgi:hypothetical protein
MGAEMAELSGGILGGDREEIARGVAELRRKQAAAERQAAEQELKEKEIEQVLGQTLHAELAAEIEVKSSMPKPCKVPRGLCVLQEIL